MKVSTTILLATIAGAAADPTHQISAAYNNLIFFDNEQIASPTFVQDFIDASTFALAGGISLAKENGQELTWENIYAHARDIFTNIGFLLESGPTVLSPEDGFCVPCLTIGEAMGSVYAKMGGPDSQELGELLQANNADVLDPEAVEVIDSWLSFGECLHDDYIVSVTYVGESPSGDQFVENYRVWFSPIPPEELQVAQPASMEAADQETIRITRVDMVRWLFNEEVYASVRDEISTKIANSTPAAAVGTTFVTTPASAAVVGPAFVLDRDEVPVEPFMPVSIVEPVNGMCPDDAMMGGDDGAATMDPSSIIEKLGACVNADTGEIDMGCIQGVLATLDPATIGKLAQCAGAGSIADMQACVEEQLGSGDMTEPPMTGNETMPEDSGTMPEDTTSPGTFVTSSGFMGFSVVALVVGLFL